MSVFNQKFLGAQSLGIVKGLQSTEKDYNLKDITSRQTSRLKVLWGVVIHSSFICACAVSKMTVKNYSAKTGPARQLAMVVLQAYSLPWQYFNIHWGYEYVTKPITGLVRAEYKSRTKHYLLIWCRSWLSVFINRKFLGGPILRDCDGPTINWEKMWWGVALGCQGNNQS